jgi:membrane-bound ClpP family serine protease
MEIMNKKHATRGSWIPQVISIIMLLVAFNPSNPYGYYTLLRIVLCASCIYLVFGSIENDKKGCAWILGIMAFIYNPIIPVHLKRDAWSVINAATIVVLVVTLWSPHLISVQEKCIRIISYLIPDTWNPKQVLGVALNIIAVIVWLLFVLWIS